LEPAHLVDLGDLDPVHRHDEAVGRTGVECVCECHLRISLAGYSETRLVPPENCDSWKMTNSAGFTGATPIWQTTWPASMPSAGLVSSSHFTKNASSGVVPKRAPLRHSLIRNALIVRLIRAHSWRSFGSNTTHWVPAKMDSS